MTESEIKRQICDWLATQKCFFWIQQAGKIPGRINRSKYLRNGVSDILGIWDRRLLAIEVKKIGGRVSDEQHEFLTSIAAHGGITIVAYKVEDVIFRLEKK